MCSSKLPEAVHVGHVEVVINKMEAKICEELGANVVRGLALRAYAYLGDKSNRKFVLLSEQLRHLQASEAI